MVLVFILFILSVSVRPIMITLSSFHSIVYYKTAESLFFLPTKLDQPETDWWPKVICSLAQNRLEFRDPPWQWFDHPGKQILIWLFFLRKIARRVGSFELDSFEYSSCIISFNYSYFDGYFLKKMLSAAFWWPKTHLIIVKEF